MLGLLAMADLLCDRLELHAVLAEHVSPWLEVKTITVLP
jgi:hypothetical protein